MSMYNSVISIYEVAYITLKYILLLYKFCAVIYMQLRFNGGREHTIRATLETPNANLYFIKPIGLLCLLCMRFGHELQLFDFRKALLLDFSGFFFILADFFFFLDFSNLFEFGKRLFVDLSK